MIIRLIISIVVLVIITCFIGFNLDNRCALNLLFHNFNSVPVFLTILVSFLSGSVCTLPFIFISRRKKSNEKNEKVQKDTTNNSFFKDKKTKSKATETDKGKSAETKTENANKTGASV